MTKQDSLLAIIIYWILSIYYIDITLSANTRRLLIISLDGFRHDYLTKYSLPTFNQIQNEGIKTTHGMQPTFVTMTFPNHISIATGMYQEDHGIIHNQFFDTKLQKLITFGTGDEGQWSDLRIEPIWITAKKQHKKSAVLFWPAAHNKFHGIRPSAYTALYSNAVTIREKIDSAIEYFRDKSYDLVMLYHYQPDRQGHTYGPDATETYEALQRLDDDINYLLTKVKDELNDDLNIIILSDHGMVDTTQVIQPFLNDYIDKSVVEENILDGAIFSLTPRPGYFEEVFDALRRIPDITVYKRDEFPARYHYSKATHRLGEIIVLPNNTNAVFSQATTIKDFSKGNHGYDNTLPSMQAIFMARGPDFEEHTEIDSLKNVDIYHIACHILNLDPNPYASAGSLDQLSHIFRRRTSEGSQSFIDISLILFVLFLNFIK